MPYLDKNKNKFSQYYGGIKDEQTNDSKNRTPALFVMFIQFFLTLPISAIVYSLTYRHL